MGLELSSKFRGWGGGSVVGENGQKVQGSISGRRVFCFSFVSIARGRVFLFPRWGMDGNTGLRVLALGTGYGEKDRCV